MVSQTYLEKMNKDKWFWDMSPEVILLYSFGAIKQKSSANSFYGMDDQLKTKFDS